MNEIEQKFCDAFCEYMEYETLEDQNTSENCGFMKLYPQKTIGIYKPDFVLGNLVIEIDGHDFHKTKEQRKKDYEKERYFIKEGYLPIRFMATEVFLDADLCVAEVMEHFDGLMITQAEKAEVDIYYAKKEAKQEGYDEGFEAARSFLYAAIKEALKTIKTKKTATGFKDAFNLYIKNEK